MSSSELCLVVVSSRSPTMGFRSILNTYSFHRNCSTRMFFPLLYLVGSVALRSPSYRAAVVTQVTGNTTYADRAEQIAYNALPATLTASMWSHQYLQQQNQIGAITMNP